MEARTDQHVRAAALNSGGGGEARLEDDDDEDKDDKDEVVGEDESSIIITSSVKFITALCDLIRRITHKGTHSECKETPTRLPKCLALVMMVINRGEASSKMNIREGRRGGHLKSHSLLIQLLWR